MVTCGFLRRACMGGHIHKREQAGCSSVAGTRCCQHSPRTRALNRMNKLPCSTFHLVPGAKPGSPSGPSGRESLLSGGGPGGASRACEKLAHGGLRCNPRILPPRIHSQMRRRFAGLRRSYSGPCRMSLKSTLCPHHLLTALERPPSPEKISRKTAVLITACGDEAGST